jgi:hypothetical protein
MVRWKSIPALVHAPDAEELEMRAAAWSPMQFATRRGRRRWDVRKIAMEEAVVVW